jgi:hypothetical protein
MVKLTIDFENPGETWWKEGGRDLWQSLLEGFEESAVVLDQSIAESWLAEAARIPGWDDGPEYAPHPVRIVQVSEDEEA